MGGREEGGRKEASRAWLSRRASRCSAMATALHGRVEVGRVGRVDGGPGGSGVLLALNGFLTMKGCFGAG